MRQLAPWFFVALALAAAPTRADIRIDRPQQPQQPPASEPPPSEPVAEQKGCGAKQDMAPEWVFGLGVLALGGWGMRRQSRRAVAAR